MKYRLFTDIKIFFGINFRFGIKKKKKRTGISTLVQQILNGSGKTLSLTKREKKKIEIVKKTL